MIKNIQSLLTEGEEVVLNARIHWFALLFPAVLLFIALVVAIAFHWLIALIIVFVTIYPAYNAFIHYYMTNLILTNKKVMYRNGFLSRDWVKLRYERVENSHLEEPIVGRFLGYSSVKISGTGAGNITVPYVKDGHEYSKMLENQLEKNFKR